jgi:hypothetical protein
MAPTLDIGGCWSRRPNFEELSRLGLALEHARNAVRAAFADDHAFRGIGDQLLDPDDPEGAAWADVH